MNKLKLAYRLKSQKVWSGVIKHHTKTVPQAVFAYEFLWCFRVALDKCVWGSQQPSPCALRLQTLWFAFTPWSRQLWRFLYTPVSMHGQRFVFECFQAQIFGDLLFGFIGPCVSIGLLILIDSLKIAGTLMFQNNDFHLWLLMRSLKDWVINFF